MERNYDRKFPTSIIAIIAVVIVAVFILVAVFAYLASTNPYYGYSGYYGGMMGGLGGGVWMLFMIPIGLIVLVIIGYAIWRGFGWGGGCCGSSHGGHNNSYGDRENAMEILRQRYARGEISKEQYEQMKRDLS